MVGSEQQQFGKEQAPFVETFVIDLSKHWDIADVQGRMTNPFIEETSTPQAQQLLHQFKRLGALKSTQDLKLRAYKDYNNEQTGLFSFKGIFENGEAMVNVTIVNKDGAVRVVRFYLKATSMRDGALKLQT